MTRRYDCRCGTCRVAATDPTQAEIARQCKAIRSTWTPSERTRRIVDDMTRVCSEGGLCVDMVNLDAVQALVDDDAA